MVRGCIPPSLPLAFVLACASDEAGQLDADEATFADAGPPGPRQLTIGLSSTWGDDTASTTTATDTGGETESGDVGASFGGDETAASDTDTGLGETIDAAPLDASSGDDGGTTGDSEGESSSSDPGSSDASETASDGESTGPRPDPEGTDPGIAQASVELVDTDFQFLEGPVWIPDEQVLRFTDLRARALYEYSPATGETIPFDLDSEPQVNGLTLDADGHLVACEQAHRRVTRRIPGEAVEVLAADYEGLAFNSPNDAVVHPNGTIYFTDPPYGGNPREITFDGVYRIDPSGALSLVERSFGSPNGIVLSPDLAFLYVSFTQSADIRRYPVLLDGSTGTGEWFANVGSTADGMTIDEAGNLYATSSDGVVVFDPTGVPWGTIALPEVPANCTFGGLDRRTLYITARTSLYAVALNVPGLAPP